MSFVAIFGKIGYNKICMQNRIGDEHYNDKSRKVFLGNKG